MESKKGDGCGQDNEMQIADGKPHIIIDDEKLRQFAMDYRVVPMQEEAIYNYKLKREHSFVLNKQLYKTWRTYMNKWAREEKQPFRFPGVSDFHFYKYDTVFKPSESLRSRTDFKLKLSAGPGVDFRGQRPIPNELHVIKYG